MFPSSLITVRFNRRMPCLAVFLATLLFSPCGYAATTFTVTNSGDSGPGTLRQAISDAASGDRIEFSPSITTVTLTSAELLIDKNLTIAGPGPNLLTVERSTASSISHFRVFNVAANDANVTISGLTVAHGVTGNGFDAYVPTDDGAGIKNVGTLSLTNCTISNNATQAAGSPLPGGGISNAGTATITDCTISNNSTTDVSNGAGINNTGTITVARSSLVHNNAGKGGASGQGGGIYNDQTGFATIDSSTISDSQARAGGGISNLGTLSITNSTVFGNAVTAGCGGIFNQSTGLLDIHSSTVTGNDADTGGGICNNNTNTNTVSAEDTIIAKNTAFEGGPDISGALTSEGYNLIGNNSGATITAASGDQIGTPGSPIDPLLGPLQDNGGPTFTCKLLQGSPAIDQGKAPAGVTVDQRGSPRPSDDPAIANAPGGDGSDIGAFELTAPTPTPTPTATATATPTPSQAQPLNISTRLLVGTGENVLIGGFILSGNNPKTVIIRAIGPSLAGAGVPSPLSDPILELYDSANNLIVKNDDWQDFQKQQIENTGLAPKNALESALVVTLNSNSRYTAIVKGKGNGTGVALVEVYDLQLSANSHLANISTRGLVQTNDNVLIGGFIFGGNVSDRTKMVIRALGPSLSGFGVQNPLQDPKLIVYDSNGNAVGQNDNWQDGHQPQIAASGLAPNDPRESALYLEFPPGNYTAIVSGVNNTTGVGLIEGYDLQ